MSEVPPPVRDPDLESYVEGIETAFRSRRGVDHVLSPREFALARGWHEAGIRLATVLVAIDVAFEADASVSSLAFCRRRVEQLAAGGPDRDLLSDHEAGRPQLPDLAERLQELEQRLQALPPRASALPLQEVAEVSDLVAVASRPNWDYLGKRLERIDELVSAAALEALGARDLASLRTEAKRLAERHRGRVDDRSLEEAIARLVRQHAREQLQLPRVSLV